MQGKQILVIVGVVAIVFALGLGAYFGLIRTKDYPAKVAAVSWERSVQVEKLKAVQHEGWEIPTGARVLKSEDKFHHWNQVEADKIVKTAKVRTAPNEAVNYHDLLKLPGNCFEKLDDVPKDLNANGNFNTYKILEKSPTKDGQTKFTVQIYRPVMVNQKWYSWEQDQWVVADTLSASGKDKNPNWPSVPSEPNTREGKKTQSYQVEFLTGDGKKHVMSCPAEAEWGKFQVGQECVLAMNAVGAFTVR